LAAENQGAGVGAGAANTHLPVIGDFGAALPAFRAESLGLPHVDSN